MTTELHTVVLTHAIRERTTVVDDVGRAVEELKVNGWTLIESGVSSSRIAELRKRIDNCYQAQLVEIGGEQRLHDMNDAHIARAPCATDDAFIDVALLGPLHAVCRALLGEAFILMSQNGILNPPRSDHYQFTWHRDLNYQHFTSSRPMALSALMCLDTFNAHTGGTYVLPGTHKVEAFPSEGFVQKHQRVVEAPAGTLILFDSMLFHRAGQNRSNAVRRGINHIITLPFLKQQYSFPRLLAGRPDLDENARRFFGFGTETAPDATTWRRERLARRDSVARRA